MTEHRGSQRRPYPYWRIIAISGLVLVLVNLAAAVFITCDDTPLTAGAPVPSGAVPVGGASDIPATATCAAGSTTCLDPGALCAGFIGRCTDTFDVVTQVCECQCLFSPFGG